MPPFIRSNQQPRRAFDYEAAIAQAVGHTAA
jgi:hypothetical protein